MKKFERNNTNFPAKLSEYVSSVRSDTSYPFLKYYQNIVRIVISNTDMQSRGLLIDHEMGLGKSILAIAVAIDMMPDRQPIILLAKSLAENMRQSIHKYVKMRANYDTEWPIGRFSPEELDQWISANFSFVSMNASNMLSQIGRAVSLDKKIGDMLEQVTSLDGKLLIVDEAHNLFRAIVNGSKNGLGLYNLVQKSKNLKIIFLTGTPIANDPFELVPCFNMLGGGSVLPEDYIEFNRLYVDETGRIKNREKFQNRLFGLVSAIKYKWLSSTEPKGEFPERLPLITVRVRMTHAQYTSYSLAREKEKEEGNRPGRGPAARTALVKPKMRGSSTYRVKSRQIGNFDGPDSLDEITDPTSPKFEAILANVDKHDGQKGLVYSQFVGMGGLAPFRKFLDNHGWNELVVMSQQQSDVTSNTTDDTYDGGAALMSAMEYIEHLTNRPNVTAGWWSEDVPTIAGASGNITQSEYDITAAMIATSPITSIRAFGADESTEGVATTAENVPTAASKPAESSAKTYVVISGDVDVEDRTRVQDIFNDPSSNVSLIIVSSTGAEGLDLKRIRHIHIMEPYWNWGRIEQIISRGVRNDSHIDLPPDQKNVQSYIYLAIPPESEDTGAPTTDVELYDDALKNRDGIDSFLDALDEVSIECTLDDRACRTCNPTGEPLYSNDPAKDVRTRDPCVPYKEEEIQTSEIDIDGKIYHYSESKDSVYGVKIFEFDTELGAYKLVRESSPIYQRIYATLNPE